MNKHLVRLLATVALLTAAGPASADWHAGKATGIHIGYDGSTVMLLLSGWTRTNCTCYSTWPTYMCLNRTRTSFKEEFAILLKARANDDNLAINIDEASCSIIALSEGT
jgi:hypothetical protein